MNKEIKETPDVKSVEQLKKIIDRFGERQYRLRKLGEEQASDKQKIEHFARLNGINRLKAEAYKLTMSEDEPRLIIQKGTTRAEVVARLKADDQTAGYVHEDYVPKEIKEYLATVPDAEATLAQLGLKLTEQQRKAEVTPIER